ncbi:metallophosphoesterase [Achromobacter xylosoxidans]|uniref:metallophosphoesterase family protein n=1 Tax=Alcaligenes xylosoxydans xylosoxydans TaxID=85698 RepID=UPI002D77F173|nr:metallophosphoesterase [Achromobacter xylosoxidans]
MHALLKLVEQTAGEGVTRQFGADYLICPGDVTNQASAAGFEAGWAQLKALKTALGARHLLATTGNHEVHSRATEKDNEIGMSIQALDPLAVIQRHPDYPCTCLSDDERWVYWGRGYQIVEQPNILFLIINSSHFHPTTRSNEFERGRISDIALQSLREDLARRVAQDKARVFVALLHHHPIPHQAGTAPEENIEMHNGSQLIQLLEQTNVAWLVIHGHKHDGRLISAQGDHNAPMVFAAASFGAMLDGVLATQTHQQFYILDLEIFDQSIEPMARVQVRAWHWTGTSWEAARKHAHGLPDRCGYQRPSFSLRPVLDGLAETLAAESRPFLKWEEAAERHAELGYLMPGQVQFLRNMMESKGIRTVWGTDDWFPQEVAK